MAHKAFDLEKVMYANLVGETEIKDPDTGNMIPMATYKTEVGWMFSVESSYADQVGGILSQDDLEKLGIPEDKLDIVFGIYSPIDGEYIIICQE